MNKFLSFLAAVGRAVIAACHVTGRVALFACSGVSHIVRPPFYGRLFLKALVDIGYFSLPVLPFAFVIIPWRLISLFANTIPNLFLSLSTHAYENKIYYVSMVKYTIQKKKADRKSVG